jgi:hypothetical protein
MNQNNPENPIPSEWLAAYVDNELDAAARCRVERWLVDHPDAVADLREQQQLAAGNREYWKSLAPPMPSPETWNSTFATIARAVPSAAPARPVTQRSRYLAPILAFVSLAAAIFMAVLAVDRQRHDRPVRSDLEFSEAGQGDNPDGSVFPDADSVYRVARVDDVELIQLPEAAASLVVIGRHPLQGVPVDLPQVGDVQLLNYGPDDQGNLPDIATTYGPGAPMLWAPEYKP